MTTAAKIRILVIGPNPLYQKSMKALLEKIGYSNVKSSHDGPTGWELMKRTDPDMVIAQWDMPEMNGIALLRLIRSDSLHSDTPVVLWTDQITKTDVIKAGESGVNAILVEPVNIENMERKINLILEFDTNPATKKAKTYLEKGDEYTKAGLFDLALKEYGSILSILESAEVYYNIGYIHTTKGEYDEALAAFRKATQINQMYAKAYQAMAEVYKKMGDTEMARKFLNMAGEILMERDMHEQAESIFNEIISLNPDTTNVYNSLGIIYRRQSRHADAVKVYRKAVKIDPGDENIHFNMGRAYLEMGETLLAKECFMNALKINPSFETAANMVKALEAMEKGS